ncbi:LCP family protein [Macrococcoides caseolyticum]|uniref:LCP family glycopolymer transferase n=1 Tax=Macrococcoides caseolyticum TaxID=69966 RepID=UPI001F2D4421|nr:LCP family protein [Macrococcus caseolyticus]MCE4957539.1 LCP family protein [Macrococcus caseolyticus]
MIRSGKKRGGCLKWIVLACFVILLAIGLYVGNAYFKVRDTANNIQHKIEGRNKSDLRDKNVSIADKDAISVALFGVDANAQRLSTGDKGRSDSIILMSINPKKNKTVMISVPRDTYSEMVGKGTQEKIAHAYAYGGAKMAVQSVEKLMNVPIDYYATVNMDGMHELIDEVGGIDVKSNATFSANGFNFVNGETVHLDGDKALAFIRARKGDGAGGDFGRQERQQIVIQGLAHKVVNVQSVTMLDSILKNVEGNVVTDMSFDDLKGLGLSYRSAMDNVKKHQLKGEGTIMEDNLWYFLPNEDQKHEVRDVYVENLNL